MTEASRNTIRLSATDRGIRAAVAFLNQSGLVAFPTETVYGLGADARSDKAVAAVFAAKNRPTFNPLIVHVPDPAAARRLAIFSPSATALADAFWPGPLTLILPLREDAGLSPLVTAGGTTVAIRVPAHALARDLLTAFGGPIAAPSANPSGKVSPTDADHVMEGLTGRIDAVLDGGPCPVGIESAIVDLSGPTPRLARPGGLPQEALEEALHHPLEASEPGKVTAPGQLASHYAPDVNLQLSADVADAGALWLTFGPSRGRRGLSLSESGDLTEAAANLFRHLREIDAMAAEAGIQRVLVDPIPEKGLGRAINDRLRRAAAPRSGPPTFS